MKNPNAEMHNNVKKCAGILVAKGCDYGDDTFIDGAKLASIMCGKEFTPQDVAAILLATKLSRYKHLTSMDISAVNESIKDTVIDTMNYVALMERERQKDEISKGKSETAFVPLKSKDF